MKKLAGKGVFRFFTYLLTFISILAFVILIPIISTLNTLGMYDGVTTLGESPYVEQQLQEDAEIICEYLVAGPPMDSRIGEEYAMSNVLYSISDFSGVIMDNESGRNYVMGLVGSCRYGEYDIVCHISAELEADDSYAYYNYVINTFTPYTDIIAWGMGVLFLASLLLLPLSIFCAGRTRDGEISNGLSVRMPIEITVAILGVSMVFFNEYFFYYMRPFQNTPEYVLSSTIFATGLGLFLFSLLNISHRLKQRRWWRRSLIWMTGSAIAKFFGLLPLFARDLFITLFLLAAFFFSCIIAFNIDDRFIILAIIAALVLVVWLCRRSVHLSKLCKSIESIAAGDYSQKLNITKTPRALRKLAANVNNIGSGMGAALESQLKGERLKTELITNVSHDLKTPLTSIINYVDLLGAEGLTGKPAEYLEVLSRQSRRLKKLTEDLLEASKASSGNIAVNAEPTDFGQLIEQAVGEYSDRFAEAGVTPVINLPQEKALIMADGRLLWRVVDNLLSNACKYSLPGTRLYINLTRGERLAAASFKNVSKAELNIPASELTERFVRGDRSRTGEGSGLGLNIAQSLTEMQRGSLMLAIDGDLFTASVSMPLCTDMQPYAAQPVAGPATEHQPIEA